MTAEAFPFFANRMDAAPLYEAFERRVLAAFADARVRASKTQIAFTARHNFAFVSFLPVRHAKDRPKTFITVTFGLARREPSPRVDACVEPYPGRFTHHVLIASPEEIDGELMAWVEESYAFSQSKR